jgi:hypothetical protein
MFPDGIATGVNHSGLNDCSTAIGRAIGEITALLFSWIISAKKIDKCKIGKELSCGILGLEFERGCTGAQSVEYSLWKRLRFCYKTNYMINECRNLAVSCTLNSDG